MSSRFFDRLATTTFGRILADLVNPSYRTVRLQNVRRVSQPLVLVSEIQRSGGTLFSQLFDGHPQLFAHPHELMWGRPDKEHWPDLRRGGEGFKPGLFRLLDQEWLVKHPRGVYRKGFRSESYPFIFDFHLQRALFKAVIEETPPRRQREVLEAYLTSFFGAWVDLQGAYAQEKRAVTAFTPRVNMVPESLKRYFNDYPDGHLITCVRDPAGWYASVVRHHYLERYGSLDGVMEQWAASTRASLEALTTYGERVILVVFDDLVLRTAAVMETICGRIGLDFDPILLKPTFNTMPIMSNSNFRSVDFIDPEVVGRWSQVLDPGDVTAIRALTDALYMEALDRSILA
jgi:hypothetical protein